MCASHIEVTELTHKSLAAMHQLPDIYFQTELFVIANRKGGLLSLIGNSENESIEQKKG
jgi:hypothetical protein